MAMFLGTRLLLLFLYIQLHQAEITPPSFGNVTYVNEGSNVNITWKYKFRTKVTYTEFSFTCTTSASGYKTLAHIGGGKLTIEDTSLSKLNFLKPSTLLLSNVSMDYNGTYRLFLIVSNGGQQESKVKVIILDQPTAVVDCPETNTINEGEQFSCLCNSTGGNPPPTASWSKNGNLINGSGYLKKKLFLNVSKENAGMYNCTVRSHNLTDTKFINVTVRYKPKIVFFKTNVSDGNFVNRNSSITITCKADAVPPATYRILHNGIDLNIVEGVYSFKLTNSSHGGKYECRATNQLGGTLRSLFLKIKEKPKAHITCNHTVVREGRNFTCVCNSSGGNPSPNAPWVKDGREIVGVGQLEKTLVFNSINRTDKGKYWCRVKSLDLFDEISIKIAVLYSPVVKSFTSYMRTITCISDGYPLPNVTLLRNGKEICENVSKVMCSITGSNDNSGVYECQAINYLGRGNTTKFLNVSAPTTTPGIIVVGKSKTLSTGAIVGIAVGGLFLIVLVVALLIWCCCPEKCRKKEKILDRYSDNVIVDDNETNSVKSQKAENLYDVAKEPIPDENPNESNNSRPSTSNTVGVGAPSTLPPVYAVVDKSRVSKKIKEDKAKDPTQVTYASLDAVALQPDSSEMHERPKVETNYASINISKL